MKFISYIEGLWLLLLFKLNINMARTLKKHVENLFNNDIIFRLNREPTLVVNLPIVINNIPSRIVATLNYDNGKYFQVFLDIIDGRLTIVLGKHNITDMILLYRIHTVFNPDTMNEIVYELSPYFSKVVIDNRKGWSGNLYVFYHRLGTGVEGFRRFFNL